MIHVSLVQDEYSMEFLNQFKYSMETRGYHFIEQYLDEDRCAELKEKLMSAIEQFKPNQTERSQLDRYLIHDLLCQDIQFCQLLEDPRLQALLSMILDPYWILYAFTSSSLPPLGNNYGSRVHVDSPRFIPNYVTNVGVMWILDDFTLANGATKVLPGSHHSKVVPTNEYFEDNSVQLVCKKGSLVIFNARVWHRAGENTTERWRHSLTMNACRPYMKQRMDWVRAIPQEIATQLNDQARRIIGYDTRLPTHLGEFFVSDGERLYKPNQE